MADLKQRLIDMCKERDKPYGMLVRKLDFPFGGGIAGLRALLSARAADASRQVSPPLLVYEYIRTGGRNWCADCASAAFRRGRCAIFCGASKETALFEYVNNS